MHIASALTFVRREPVQSNVAAPLGRRGFAPPVEQAAPARVWTRKALAGGILVAVLALLGGLFPILF